MARQVYEGDNYYDSTLLYDGTADHNPKGSSFRIQVIDYLSNFEHSSPSSWTDLTYCGELRYNSIRILKAGDPRFFTTLPLQLRDTVSIGETFDIYAIETVTLSYDGAAVYSGDYLYDGHKITRPGHIDL